MTRTQRPKSTPDRRVPPHDLAIERALLGAMLLSRDAIAAAGEAGVLRQHFYAPIHGTIYDAIVGLYLEDVLIDSLVVADRVGATLESFGGRQALDELALATPLTANASHYADTIVRHARQRLVIALAGETASAAYEGTDWHQAAAKLTETTNLNGVVINPSTLEMVDLDAILSGAPPDTTTFWCRRADGHALIYPGKVHDLHAEPSHGKTWLAVHAVAEVIAAGGAALYLDYEDSPISILERLRAVGVAPELLTHDAGRFRYLRPSGPLRDLEVGQVDQLIDELSVDLLILDGVAEALARDGYDETSNSDVVTWGVKVPRHFSDLGPAVVMLDHVKKDPKERTRGARGAGAKLGLVNGASYEMRMVKPWSRRRPGFAKVVIAKDRNGQVGSIGDTIAHFQVTPAQDGKVVDLGLELAPVADDGGFKPTGIMERISAHLAAAGGVPHPFKIIYDSVRGKRDYVRQALAALVTDGFVREEQHSGETRYVLVRPYEEHPSGSRRVTNEPDDHDSIPMPDDPIPGL